MGPQSTDFEPKGKKVWSFVSKGWDGAANRGPWLRLSFKELQAHAGMVVECDRARAFSWFQVDSKVHARVAGKSVFW